MPVSFSNPVVDLSDLPQLEDDRFVPVERSYFWLRIGLVLGVAVIAVVAAVVVVSFVAVSLTATELAAAGLIMVVGVVATSIGQWLEVSRMGFLLREHDFSFRRGVLRTTVTTIPFSRVQNVTIDRGPIMRLLGLASLRLHSAGGTLHVTGIRFDSAEELKSYIVDRARTAADLEQAAR